MNCPFCGAKIDGNFAFCVQCGSKIPEEYLNAQASNTNEPIYNHTAVDINEINTREFISGTKPAFILGIISIALAVATNYIAAGLPAIVCGVISLIKSKNLPEVMPEYIYDPKLLASYQSAVKKAALSKKLSIAGIIVAILIDVFYVLLACFWIFCVIGLPTLMVILSEL